MKVPTFLSKTNTWLTNIPLKIWLIGGGVIIAALYSAVFFIPKTIQFSYASPTCVPQFVLAPAWQKADSPQYEISFQDEVRIGSWTLAAGTVCVTPKEAPQAGNFTASVAPFGGVVAQKRLVIQVPEAPLARANDLVGKTISTARPLKIKLTAADIVHTYRLKIADKTTTCTEEAAELSCDIAALKLSHGAEYSAALYQAYKDATIKLVEGAIETLQPLKLQSADITNDQTVYTTPTHFSFTFDQALTSASAKLEQVEGDSSKKVTATTTTSGPALKVSFETLAREATYRLTVTEAVGENGNSIAEPLVVTFKTSGGPKVSSVSVGSTSVSRNATVIVTFDQPLAEDADIAKYTRVEGIPATVRRQSDTQLAFTLQGGDCTAFTLVIDKGIKSGANNEVSKDDWRFASRTICGYAWTIGRSVQGRAIVAYSFGSGGSTILFTGGMHGSEPSGYSTMMAWVQYLQAYGNTIPAGKRVVVVPNTNPDGIAVGSRNNSRNVNIDRNFPTANWKASIETASGTLPTGGGTSAGSEPETAAVMALTRQLRPRLEVSFHAQGSLVGANKYGDSVEIGNIYARTVGYATMYYDAEAVMGYPMTGEYEDWMGEELGVPAILIELPTTAGNYLTNTHLTALKKMLSV